MPRSEGVSVGREGLLGGEVPRQLHSTPGGLHPVTGSPYPIAQRAWTHTRQTFRSFAGRHPCGVLTPPSRTEDTEWPLPRSSIFRQRTVWCHADVRRVPARDCPPKAFRRGLELGAGDAFQSSLLAHYVDFLVVTDFSDQILEHEDTPQRVHRVCDAEQVDEAFAAGEFDLVFSSNMMEHAPRPQRVLAGGRVLSDDGIAIHVMPSPFWKAWHMLGFHVDAVLTRLERYSTGRLPKLGGHWSVPLDGNNHKLLEERSHGRLRRLLWPIPHGVSRGNWEEFLVFRRKSWQAVLEGAGFELVSTLRGPVSSGYGFGLDRVRAARKDGSGIRIRVRDFEEGTPDSLRPILPTHKRTAPREHPKSSASPCLS